MTGKSTDNGGTKDRSDRSIIKRGKSNNPLDSRDEKREKVLLFSLPVPSRPSREFFDTGNKRDPISEKDPRFKSSRSVRAKRAAAAAATIFEEIQVSDKISWKSR